MTARLVIPTTLPDWAEWDAPARTSRRHRGTAAWSIGHNTLATVTTDRERNDEPAIGIVYHATEILTYNQVRGSFRLDTGGWRTVTTKSRLNTLGAVLGFRVFALQGVWYLADSMGERPFYDGIRSLGSRRCAIGCECGAR